MSNVGTHELLTKCLSVIWSCKTTRQLEIAWQYVNLASQTPTVINNTYLVIEFFVPIERCAAVVKYRIDNGLT